MESKPKIRLPEFVKYPKILYTETFPKIFGQEGYVFEKIDGSLAQVRKTEAGIVGGSKANYLIGNLTRVSWFPNFLKWMRSNHSLINLPLGVIMFGEWLRPGRLKYHEDKLNKFYFIDLGFVSGGKMDIFDYKEALDYLKKWRIENVEILNPIEKTFFDESDIRELVLSRKSQLGGCDMEGVVLKNYRTQEFAKFLHPEYSEIREQENTLERKYLTTQRIAKALVRLKEEKYIQKPSLEELASEIVRDINEEVKISFNPEAVIDAIRVTELYHGS